MKIRQKELNNLDVLTQGLRQSEIKDIEISVLNTLYKDNEKQFKNGLNVFDSQGFLNALENLNNYQFKSQEAKDFIKYTKDFNKLFYNDVKIASSIFEPKATSSSSTMATSIQGSAQVKITNFLMDSILRNLSLPFFLRGGTMDQSISKRALKFQIERALNHADGLSDFKKILQSKTKTGDFSNGTRKALEQFTQALEKSEDEFYEQLKRIESKDLNASLQEEKNADIIGGLRQQAGEPKGLKPPTSKDDYNTNAKFSQEHIKQVLEHLQAQDITRKHLSDEEINALLKRFDNIDNLKEHLYTRADAQTRKALFDLIDETLYNPHFKYIKDGKTKYLKKFKDTDKDKDAYFYLLITKDQDKTFITHLKSRDYNYFAKELSTAEQLLQGENLIKIKPKDEALNAKTQEGLKQDVQSQDLEKAWLNTFHLKSLDEDFIPNLNAQAREALKDVLKDKPLKINRADFEKLRAKDRLKYINEIKDTLENPQLIFKDAKGDLIFAKEIKEKLFLTNISREYEKGFLSVSISPKKVNTIKNKLEKAQNIYLNKLDFKLRESSAQKAFTGVLSLANKPNSKQSLTNQSLKHNETLENAGVKDLKNAKNTSEESLNAKTQEGLKQDVQSQDLEKAWLNTFHLKSLDEDFIPHFSDEVKEALKSQGINEIKLKRGSFEKLLKRQRTAFLPYIKPTLENPDALIKHDEALIFIKDIGKESFFTSISKDVKGEMIIKTNSFKTLQNLTNKFKQNATLLYLNKKAPNILAEAFTGETFPAKLEQSLSRGNNLTHSDNNTLTNKGLKDDETLEKSKKQKPLSQDLDLNKAKTSEIKQVFLKELQPLFNEVLTSKEGKEAHLNLKSLSKMLSDTAINKSLKNGFTREQHLKAVREIKSLFENAHLAHIEKGTKPTDKDLIINRFNSDFENANALITTKEHLDTNKNRIYSVELEITPRFNANETPLNNANNQGQTHLTQATSGEVKEPLAPIDKPDNDTLANQSLKDDETFNTKPETKELLESPGKELEHKFSFVDKLFKDFVNPSLKEKATQALEHSFTDLTKENNITLKDLQAFKKSINKRYLNKDFNKKLTSSLNMTISLVKAHPEYMDIVANPLISRIKIAFHDELIPYLKANDETIAHITGYKPAEIKEFKKVLQNNLKELESLLQTNIHQTPLRELFSQSDRAVELEKSTNAIFDKLFNNEYIKNLQIMYIQNGIISDSQLLKALKEFHTKNKVSPDTQELIKRLEKQIEEDESLKFEALTLTRSKLDNLKNFTMTRESFTRQRKLAESLQGINPIEDFGQNYSEFYHTGKAAIDKILAEARDYEARNATQELTESELKNGSFKAQVAGAFYREDLNALSGNGNIDVVFGDSRFGLKHILEKHPDIIEKIPEIIQKGVIVENAGVKTIILKENNKEYRAGLSKGFNGKGTNEWILTSYKKNP